MVKMILQILKRVILISFIGINIPVMAQRGGESIFGLLHLTQSAKIASLGGNQVGITGHDLAMLIHNPAMLDSSFSKQVSVSYVPYMAGINYGYGGIAMNFNQVGNFALAFQNIGYGDFIASDETGTINGSFSVGETVISLTYSRPLNKRYSAGLSIKPVFSRIENYNSWGLAFDAGLFYRHPDGLLSAGLVLRNFGSQISSYSDAPTESLPPDLQIGVSKKLAHAPFRFSLTFQDLLSGSLDYTIPDNGSLRITDNTGSSYGEKIMRHLVLGTEFLPSKNFYLAVGYNARRRHELKIESKSSTVGFTWGFGLRLYKFHFSYGSGRYHLGGSSNHFSISTNLTSF